MTNTSVFGSNGVGNHTGPWLGAAPMHQACSGPGLGNSDLIANDDWYAGCVGAAIGVGLNVFRWRHRDVITNLVAAVVGGLIGGVGWNLVSGLAAGQLPCGGITGRACK
jgi:hypothetical protein